MPDEVYDVYQSAFNQLQSAARNPSVSILSVAQKVQELIGNCSGERRRAMSLALSDALGCLPRKSREHLARILYEQRIDPNDSPD